MTDALEATFDELRRGLVRDDRLAPTHADPFFTFVHDPATTLELHRRLPRWRGILRRDGFSTVDICSLSSLAWEIVDASGRWDDWLEAEEPGKYVNANKSMRDVLLREENHPDAGVRPGLLTKVAHLLQPKTPGRIVLLTHAELLHPWFRADKLGASLHDRIGCPTVLFYPGRRVGQYGLHFLKFHAEDGGSYRTTIVGGL